MQYLFYRGHEFYLAALRLCHDDVEMTYDFIRSTDKSDFINTVITPSQHELNSFLNRVEKIKTCPKHKPLSWKPRKTLLSRFLSWLGWK